MPLNATSQARPSALPDAWIDRLFGHMAALYGSKFADLWGASDTASVKAMWAEKLAGFADSPGCIKAALSALDDRPLPPTLPEFLVLCRNAAKRIGDGVQALPHKLTGDDHDRIKATAEAAISGMKAKHRDGIDHHWATHPRSAMHLKFIFDAAKNDARFRPCIESMVKDGICTEGGSLLKMYRDQTFVRA